MNRRLVILVALALSIDWTVAKDPPAKRQGTPADCLGNSDVVFVVDGSDNVGKDNFLKELDFVKNTVSKWNNGPDGMHVGLVTYGDTAHNQFYPNAYTTTTDIQNAIDTAPFVGGSSNAAEAIKFAYENSFNPARGSRAKSPHTIILVTNTGSNQKDLTLLESKNAKDNGNSIYTVGIGGAIDPFELSQVSSDPDSRYILKADSYQSLGGLADYLALKACNEIPIDPKSLPAPTSCLHKADLVFMLDSSSSVGPANFQKLEGFLKEIVKTLDVGPDAVHVGVSQFSSRPTLDVSLNKYTNRGDLLKAIGKINFIGGGTNTADALKFVRENMFQIDGRTGVPHIGILITDGKSSSTVQTTQEANLAHQSGIGLISIGVGSVIDRLELNAVASDPDSQNVFTAKDYDDLTTIISQVMAAACKVTPGSQGSAAPHATETCVDTIDNCYRYGLDVCTQYADWAQANCQRYCGQCRPLMATTPAPCVDALSNCDSYGRNMCTDYKPWAKQNCPVYCGLCAVGSTHTGFYGKCFYKGIAYGHGETWQDGCAYECSCVDGTAGKYQCYNRCPVYYNLPTGCTLVKKSGECCLQPVCNFKPKITSMTGSEQGLHNGIAVCMYKGKYYYDGQQWEDGCDYTCTCTDANTGAYTCNKLCGKYDSLPGICTLQQSPGQCCAKPVCEFNQQQGHFVGYGAISGQGLDMKPTDAPPCKDILDNCASYGRGVCTSYQTWAQQNCRKYCNMCDTGKVISGKNDRCLFKGSLYQQGEAWRVSCNTECVCENAVYGYYRCVNTCPTYNNLPSGCKMATKTGQCCPDIECSAGTFYSSSTNLNTIGNGGMISTGTGSGGYVAPTLPSGATAQPGTGGTGFQAPKLDGCLYGGHPYAKNQRWNDVCSKSCICLDDKAGLYSCRPRCPTYANLPTECTMVPNENDPCCKVPECTGTAKGFVPIPAFGQSVTAHGLVRPPSIGDLWKGVGGYASTKYGPTVPAPSGETGPMKGIGYCTYKGKHYIPGQTWEDGCDFNCVCDDARFGHYKCTDKCVKYTNIPKPYCHLIPDPRNPCCKVPHCNFTAPYQGFTGYASLNPTTHAPVSNTVAATPGLPFCEYKGKHYNTGQQWYDGCDFKCKCDDAINNKYTCLTRCAEYENLAPGCTLKPDPQDPTCCKIPECAPSMVGTPTAGTGLVPKMPTVPMGSHLGSGPTGSTNIGYCEYKGVKYSKGQTWEDGCDYNCVCEDATSGDYKCTNKCPRYETLPSQCRLITDFTNPCCKVPKCDLGTNLGHNTGIGQPSIGGTPTPGTGPTPAPSFCEYKGVQYAQGQEWHDGCDQKCRCDNSANGIYTCNTRCANYEKQTGDCKMVTDPKDACCLIPVCTYNPGTPVPIGGPTPGGGVSPGLPPGQTPGIGGTPNQLTGVTPGIGQHGHPIPFPFPTAAVGKVTGEVKIPTPTPGLGGVMPSPITIRSCEYKGVTYSQGQRWRDGCTYMCECTNALSGKYECTDLCPRYVQLPSYCTLVKDPANPCCEVPQCIKNPTQVTNPIPLPGTAETPLPGHSPSAGTGVTPGVGHTPGPGMGGTPTPGVGVTPTPRDVCVYKGKQYTQGQSWFDGCDYKCECENAYQGVYRCNDRCTAYDTIPPHCTMTPDPKDPFCCTMPKCDFTPQHHNETGYGLIPTLPPGSVSGGKATPTPYKYKGPTPVGFKFPTVPAGFSTPHPFYTPTPVPGYTFFPHYVGTPTPAGTPGPGATQAPDLKNVCVYKGKTYNQGQRWEDGCDYVCVCENGMTGYYKCSEKCPRYDAPPECQMVRDYLNPCCEKPYCDFTATTTTPTPQTPGTGPIPTNTGPQTPKPPTPDVCVYNGVTFSQGQTWNDGCALKCRCEDAKSGFYRCDHRCLQYEKLGPTCTLKTDPSDSCCKVPFCAPVMMSTPNPHGSVTPGPGGSTPLPGYTPSLAPGATPNLHPHTQPTDIPFPVPTAVPGIKTGNAVKPNTNPTDNTTSGCLYNGVLYKTGQKWQDGCDFNCECIDGKTGQYRCPERCAKYFDVPANCMLVPDPKDSCCQTPSCLAPLHTTPHTGMTPPPSLGPGQTPDIAGTPTPQSLVPQPKTGCTYKGVSYTQGQQWYDGCDKVCVCENGMEGHYRCSDRCTQYKNVSPTCTMVADPRDPACCQIPQCIPMPGQPGFSTPKPGGQPSVVTNVPGYVTGKAPVMASTPTPGPDGKMPTLPPGQTPAPTSGCQYKGKVYAQGQRWQDGCKFNCVCDDAHTGLYTCGERCAAYPQLPPQCQLVQDPKDFCCSVSVCDWDKPTPSPRPPMLITTPTPVGILTPGVSAPVTPPGMLTPSPGATFPSGYTPKTASTHGPIPTIPPNPIDMCVYKGVPYAQGQAWQDGCSQKCRCEDAMNNYYTCFDRCPSYQLKAGCQLVTDPSDPCCQVPQCVYVPTPAPGATPFPGSTDTPQPGVNPSLPPGQTPKPGPVVKPSPLPTSIPGVITGNVPSTSGNTNPHNKEKYCVYKGSMYKTGQKWQDGCDFNCVCVDDTSGQYQCTERCAKYVNIPAYCIMVDNPDDKCCKKPSCSGLTKPDGTPTPNPLATPGPGATNTLPPGVTPNIGGSPTPGTAATPNPIPKDVCIYNGKAYTQGQQWYQGCDKICVCDDAHTGLYSCNARCPSYSVAPNCVMVPDPSDPMCCKAPKCDNTNSTTGVIGTITGHGLPPTPGPQPTYLPGQSPSPGTAVTPNPLSGSTPTPPKVCVYKGVAYKEGQKWQDGCLYDCICENGMTGNYKCTDRCPRYPSLSLDCILVYDPTNPCCKKPVCGDDRPTPVPGFSSPVPVTIVTPAHLPGQTPAQPFCVYNGVAFRQGATWKEGCSKVCRCEDAATRQVNCDDRCPKFPNVPAGCTLATDPNDPCCHVVNCASNLGNPTGVKGVPGVITGHAMPEVNPQNPYVTGTRDVCVYNGKTYKQGEQWNDGCTYSCECIDAKAGNYRCVEKCPRYPLLPAHCTMVQDPRNVCCKKPFCPLTPTQPPALTPVPGVVSTPAPGVSPSPGVNPPVTPHTANTPAPPDLCVYKGQQYKQGQMWFDGCDSKCFCEDAKNNYYRCVQRCASYQTIPTSCTLVPDPKDPTCCEVPNCPIPTPGPGIAPTPGFIDMKGKIPAIVTGHAPVPTAQPGKPPLMPGVTPSINPFSTPGTGPIPSDLPPVTPLPKTGCYYKNNVYQKGQKWDDGCKMNCECVDDMTGQYKCTEKCTKFPQLPVQCVMVQDPSEPCCKKPYCDFMNPTPFPFGFPTPGGTKTPATLNPGINPSAVLPTNLAGGFGSGTFGGRGFCVYQGVYYPQAQTWNQGCDKTCRCEDVSTGYYSCHERCPSFDNVPKDCKLVSDPTDACCLVPDCNHFSVGFITSPVLSGTNGPLGPGTVNNYTGTGTLPPIMAPTVIPGSITGMGGSNQVGGPSYGSFGSSTRSACVYKGVVYKQGQTWTDGCTYNCECVDGARGQYRCTDRCPKYVNLPPQCTYHPDPSDQCCQKATCDFTPTLAPGETTPTPTTTQKPVIAVISGKCIYKDGSQHPQGEMWSVGCDYNCKCDDASKNVYTCDQKCRAYSGLPKYCKLEPDPYDKCCEKPVCDGGLVPLSGSNKVTASPTLKPSINNIIPLGTHSIIMGTSNPHYNPTTGEVVGGREVCIYQGKTYAQGQSWDDGCKYVCNCQDAKSGLYKCTSKCPKFPPLPAYCKLQDIPGQCCPSLTCNVPGQGTYAPVPQLVPIPGPTPDTLGHVPTIQTPSQQLVGAGQGSVFGGSHFPGGGATVPPGELVSGLRGVCVYKSQMYKQGEKWKDACDYECECLDARSGYYSCKPLCADYSKSLPKNCYLVKAPTGCCQVPMCKKPDGSTVDPVKTPGVYPVFGSFNAGFSSFRPGYNVDTGSTFGHSSAGCVYKGTLYKQDDTWEDGCDFHCECVNAAQRQYRCNPKCPSYTNLPPPCRLEDSRACCKVVNCNPLPTKPTGSNTNCKDKLDNCVAYGTNSCTGQYEPWAKINCQAFCGLCPSPGAVSVSAATAGVPCTDAIDNCADYGTDSCSGIYLQWAQKNCRKTCKFCKSGTGTTTTTHAPITVEACVDLMANCQDYGKASCVPPYDTWAKKNCRSYCGFCKATQAPAVTGQNHTPIVIAPLPTEITTQCSNRRRDWIILMKGVAGVPGDLYSLWAGSGTSNQRNTDAMNLTSLYKGHYKPEIANQWDTCKFDKVKLAIYKKGVEVANIIFNATGAGKTDWMDPSRILSSTYSDIKNAPHDIFSLKGDSSTGREFYASSESNGCDAYGWMMLSTKGTCFYERVGAKPAFYYSPTRTRSHWGFTNPGEGDIMAILGNGGTCQNNTNQCQETGMCLYLPDGKYYKTGEKWQDGCKFKCECVDGSQKKFRCTALCPTFTNLPKNCRLVKTPGECCGSPVCQEQPGVCNYKGTNYRQGQTWEDGCDYKCTCSDGARGFYRCQTKCLQWDLPAVCHLDKPAAGKCCSVPSCPDGYVISLPPGYKEE